MEAAAAAKGTAARRCGILRSGMEKIRSVESQNMVHVSAANCDRNFCNPVRTEKLEKTARISIMTKCQYYAINVQKQPRNPDSKIGQKML